MTACSQCIYAQVTVTPLLQCRRRAPVTEPTHNKPRRGGVHDPIWPDVSPSDWCGEFVERRAA